MAFTKLQSNTHNLSGADKVYIICSGKQYGIIIGKDIATQLTWKLGERCILLMGDGEDEGFLRIEKSEDGYVFNRMSQQSQSLKIQRGNFPNVERVKHDREFCDYKIVDGGLNIELPEWCLPSDLRRPQQQTKPIAKELAGSGINDKIDVIIPEGRLSSILKLLEPVQRRCDRPNCGKMFKTNVTGRTFCGLHKV